MYKEKKFFGLLALLLMGCGSMVAQSKLAPMVSAYVQQAYNGDGVIIGVIDSGFDCTHPVFKDENGNLRIKAVYMSGMTYTDGKGKKAVIDGKEVDGSLFDTPDMILDTLQLKQTNTFHGVHVAGCAAASPVANVKGTAGGSLAGIAPKAELIFSDTYADEQQNKKYEGSTTNVEVLNVINAMNYMEESVSTVCSAVSMPYR